MKFEGKIDTLVLAEIFSEQLEHEIFCQFEAMAWGLPDVASKCAERRDLIEGLTKAIFAREEACEICINCRNSAAGRWAEVKSQYVCGNPRMGIKHEYREDFDRMKLVYGDDRPGEGGASDYFNNNPEKDSLVQEE